MRKPGARGLGDVPLARPVSFEEVSVFTDDELKLASHMYALRHDEEDRELWACVADEMFSEATRLMERGWLDRAWRDDEMLFRLSDEG